MTSKANLSQTQLLTILSLSKHATAIYTGEDVVIAAANEAMLAFWGKENSIVGLPLAIGVPELVGQPFIAMLREVWNTGVTNAGEAIPARLLIDGRLQTFYYDYEYRAILDADGKTYAILHTAADVSEKIYARQQLKATEKNLRNMVRQAPVGMCIVSGAPLYVDEVNDLFLEIIGKKREAFTDTPYWEVNLEAKIFYEPITDQVMGSGVTFHAKEHEILLVRKGVPEIVFVDFVYEPMLDAENRVNAIMIVATEVTDKVLARNILQTTNEEMAATNEELAASNEELTVTNEELIAAQQQLEQSLSNLADSESNFRNVIIQSPVAMGLFRGLEMRLELINDRFLDLWNRNDSIIGKTLLEALPELKDQPYPGIMQEVYRSGQTYYGNESEVYLMKDGVLEKGFYNFINHPFLAGDGNVKGVIVIAIDVTEQVRARRQLQQAEEMLRLAVEAARIGSWFIEPETKTLKYNSILAKIFGYEGELPMTYEQAIGQVGEDFRERILREIDTAIGTGENYDITYTHTRFNDGEVVWLRSLGRITPDDQGIYTIFSGVVMDVTEQKADEQRKNDFIGMVSHELKTPLTTLNALVQVANLKLKTNPDTFLTGAMEKAQVQVKRMSNMINGFLNVSRLESGKIDISKQSFDLTALLQEVISETELTLNSHVIHLDESGTIQVTADRDKINSVISNLLSNAIKYSPNAKLIDARCTTENDQAVISVRDYGLGVKGKDVPKLFERYYRVESNTTQHISGFGIGLYLSAEIIRRHNGEIWATSEYGQGSTFCFSLPLHP